MRSRQPGTITAYSPGARGGSHSREMNGPENCRLPRVITCSPPLSLTRLAVGVLDGANLGLFDRRNGIELPRLGRRLLGVGRPHGPQVIGGLEPPDPGELVGVVELLA